jgi:hypothetical protein
VTPNDADGTLPRDPGGLARLRPTLVVVVAVALVVVVIAIAWTRDDGGGSVVSTDDYGFPPVRAVTAPPATGVPTAATLVTPTSARISPTAGAAPTTTAAPGTPEADIEAAVQALFGRTSTADDKLARIDRPDGLRDVIAQGLADPRAAVLTVGIQSITRSDPDAASVTIQFALSGQVVQVGPPLLLVRTAAGWQAVRGSYCALIATGGPPCPPDPDLVG